MTRRHNIKLCGKGIHGIKKMRKSNISNSLLGISKPALRRLARRGGVKRIHSEIYEESRQALRNFLEITLKDALIYMNYSKRKIVTALDIVYAMKTRGKTLYGFGG